MYMMERGTLSLRQQIEYWARTDTVPLARGNDYKSLSKHESAEERKEREENENRNLQTFFVAGQHKRLRQGTRSSRISSVVDKRQHTGAYYFGEKPDERAQTRARKIMLRSRTEHIEKQHRKTNSRRLAPSVLARRVAMKRIVILERKEENKQYLHSQHGDEIDGKDEEAQD